MQIDTGKLWRSVAGFLLGCAALALLTWVTFALDLKPLAAGLFYVALVVILSMLGEIVPAIARWRSLVPCAWTTSSSNHASVF